jgi:hypothetical protein
VDGLTSTTAAAWTGESERDRREDGVRLRGHGPGGHASGSIDRSGPAASLHRPLRSVESRERPHRSSALTAVRSARVQQIAPAHWKSTDARARLRAFDWSSVIAAPPAQRSCAAVKTARAAVEALPPSATQWLLPPAWPLDELPADLAAGAHQFVDAWLVPWIQATGTRALRPAILAGVAMFALAAAVLFMPHGGVPLAPRNHAWILPAAATPRPVTQVLPRPSRLAALPSPSMPLPSSQVIGPVAAGLPIANERKPWTDVSTMDLMMPIAEPDLDITSRTSLWSQVGKAAGVDPLLLYSVALVESKALYPDGKVAPTPWLFRVNDHLVRGDRHDVQLAMAAASQFGSAVQDVGIMQVYYPMHRDAVRDPLSLLNPRTNISVAAKILRAGMRQTPDRVLGVGYYHSHTPSLARDYGTAVMTVYQRLRAIHHLPLHRSAQVR